MSGVQIEYQEEKNIYLTEREIEIAKLIVSLSEEQLELLEHYIEYLKIK